VVTRFGWWKKPKKANRFKPVVIYMGPFKLEKGQNKTIK
jgi:ABC-type oligopeptide transport system substrate-binding subunit